MARIQTNAVISRDSGAFTVDGNLATLSGYACLAGGVTLAGAVGMAVAPVPTLGLCLTGGGLVAAGNITTIKEYFASPKAPVMSGDSAPDYDVTDGGKYQSVDEMGDTATVVA
jgi:hypothetical protein